jgi:hypothetical protein
MVSGVIAGRRQAGARQGQGVALARRHEGRPHTLDIAISLRSTKKPSHRHRAATRTIRLKVPFSVC